MRQGVALGAEIAPDMHRLTPDFSQFTAQQNIASRGRTLLEGIHLVLKIVDDLINMPGQLFGQHQQTGAGHFRAIAGLQRLPHLLHRAQAVTPGGDDALAVDPDAQRDHVERIGAGIAIDTAQGHQRPLAHAAGTWPGIGGKEGIDHHIGQTKALLQPVRQTGAGVVRMQPEWAGRWRVLFECRSLQGPGAATAVETVTEQHSFRPGHRRILPSLVDG
jgi:hypothetical protein